MEEKKEKVEEEMEEEEMEEEEMVEENEKEDGEMLEVLYCSCYGGWGISKKARELYRNKMNELNPSTNNIRYSFYERHDPLLVSIFKELGKEFDDKYSRSDIKLIPKKYEKYYDIQEYDGLETVAIDYYRYNADNFMNGIKKILKSEMNNDEKIKEIESLVLNTKNM